MQVRDGEILRNDPTKTLLEIPECCPEGVYGFQPQYLCGCSDNKSDAPYRVNMLPATRDPVTGGIEYNLRVNVTQVQVSSISFSEMRPIACLDQQDANEYHTA